MKIITIILAILSANINLFSQTDFVIPDAPAFAVIQRVPSIILRPSTSKEWMADVGSAILNNNSQNSLGIEYSFEKKFKLPISVSYATNLSNERSVAFGLRWDIFNEISAKKDDMFNETLKKITNTSNDLISLAEHNLALKYNIDTNEVSLKHSEELGSLASSLVDASQKFKLLRESAKLQTETLLWNKKIFSFAIASSFNSKDSTYQNLQINNRKIQFWGIYAFNIGNEIQINSNLTAINEVNNNVDSTAGGFGIRGHYGSNNIKVLLDATFLASKSSKPKIEFSLGGEFNISENYWLVGRLVYNAISEKVVPTFDLKVGI